jgi:hypothetical protein
LGLFADEVSPSVPGLSDLVTRIFGVSRLELLDSKTFALAVNDGLILASVLNQQLKFVHFDFSEMLATAMSGPAIPAVVDFSAVFSEAYASHRTSAGLVETLMPDVSRSTWLLITSNSLVGATESTTLTMVLERAIPLGVAIALDVAWQPNSWGLKPGSKRRRRFCDVFIHWPKKQV